MRNIFGISLSNRPTGNSLPPANFHTLPTRWLRSCAPGKKNERTIGERENAWMDSPKCLAHVKFIHTSRYERLRPSINLWLAFVVSIFHLVIRILPESGNRERIGSLNVILQIPLVRSFALPLNFRLGNNMKAK